MKKSYLQVGKGIPLAYEFGFKNPYINNNQQDSNSAYGPISSVSYGKATGHAFPGMIGPNLGPYPYSTANQTGGINEHFKYIYHPINLSKVNLDSKIGSKLLKRYLEKIKDNRY